MSIFKSIGRYVEITDVYMCVYIYKHASFMNARDQSLAYDPMIVHCLTNNIIVFINNNTLKI